MTDAELDAAIAGRAGWQLDELGAVYAPSGALAHVRVRRVQAPASARHRYIATIVQDGTAVRTTPWPAAVTAVRWSEATKLS